MCVSGAKNNFLMFSRGSKIIEKARKGFSKFLKNKSKPVNLPLIYATS